MTHRMLLLAALIVLFTLLANCVAKPARSVEPERYLTTEQDATLRRQCEPFGCVIVPTPIWRELRERSRQMGV
jgi:hypothetical protein